MDQKQMEKAKSIIHKIIDDHGSLRSFARLINEDSTDVFKWKQGKAKIKCRALVAICKIYDLKPFDLRPDIFPENLVFNFKKMD